MLKPSPVGAPIRGLNRPHTIRVRVNKREQDAFNAAANLAGITASSWCRMVLRQAASASLHSAGKVADL